MAASQRFRAWTFLVYPDSAPSDWRKRLNDARVPWCESPLHEYDVKDDGTLKKAHIHCILYFGGKKSYDQVYDICDGIAANNHIEAVNDKRAYIRYLVHADDPDKYQYSKYDIVCHFGFSLSNAFDPDGNDRIKIIREMMQFIEDNGITEFWKFESICAELHPDTWLPLLYNNCAYIVDMKIRSIRNYLREVPK